MTDEVDLHRLACQRAGASDPVNLASLLKDLIDEETQSMHLRVPRGILIRLKSIIDNHLEGP